MTNGYRAILPEQCTFNFDVAIDITFIKQQPILHAVFEQTHFLRAASLAKKPAPLNLDIYYANLTFSDTVRSEGLTSAILTLGAQQSLPIGDYFQEPQTSLNKMDPITATRR